MSHLSPSLSLLLLSCICILILIQHVHVPVYAQSNNAGTPPTSISINVPTICQVNQYCLLAWNIQPIQARASNQTLTLRIYSNQNNNTIPAYNGAFIYNILANTTSYPLLLPYIIPKLYYVSITYHQYPTIQDVANFTLTAEITQMIAPENGVNWRTGGNRIIRWLRSPIQQHEVNIEYSFDGGNNYVLAVSQLTVYPKAYYNTITRTTQTVFEYNMNIPIGFTITNTFKIKIYETSQVSYPIYSPVFAIVPFSSSWALFKGVYRGTETISRYNAQTQTCETITCPFVTLSFTNNTLLQSYPPDSPCGLYSSQADLSYASMDPINGIYQVKNDISRKCLSINKMDDNTWKWTSLQSSMDCPSTTMNYTTTGCGSTDAASISVFSAVPQPLTLLAGNWKGRVRYALPDMYGGCVIGYCDDAKISFSADSNQLAVDWPFDCAAGNGKSVTTLLASKYDGTFYASPTTSRCTRLYAAGNKLYRTIGQQENVCVMKNLTLGCKAGQLSFDEEYYSFSSALSSFTIASVSYTLTLVSAIFLCFF